MQGCVVFSGEGRFPGIHTHSRPYVHVIDGFPIVQCIYFRLLLLLLLLPVADTGYARSSICT